MSKIIPFEMPEARVFWHPQSVTREDRENNSAVDHRSVVLWFTGFSGSGKSTLANAVAKRLHGLGRRTFVLDGDNVRHGLCADLGFSEDDRRENIRRVSEVAKLFRDAGIITLAAFISPLKKDRENARQLITDTDFIEIHCHCPISVCESRDPKGLYKRARRNEIQEFTGITSPYEAPESPEVRVATSELSIDESVDLVIDVLKKRSVLCPSS